MSNAELAALLNQQAGLTGSNAVTVNVIRQWVAWNALPNATAIASTIGKNPTWVRSSRDIQRAVRLAEHRKMGLRRETAVIAQAYLEWGRPGIDEARPAILKEFRRARSQLLKGLTSALDFDDFAALSSTRKRAINTQSGPLDRRFIDTPFQQSSELYALALQAGVTGDGDIDRMNALLISDVGQISPLLAPVAANPILVRAITSSFQGALGDPDEIGNSAESLMKQAADDDWRVARCATASTLRMMRRASAAAVPNSDVGIRDLFSQLSALAPQISQGAWALFIFAAMLIIGKEGLQRLELEMKYCM